MRKLKLIEHMSLDGVVQHSADENGFPYADWTAPYRTPEGREAMLAAYGGDFDLLLGRRTYDLWSGYWPKVGPNPMGDRLNAATKFVVTHRPESLEWGPVQGVGPDLVQSVTQVKAKGDRDLILAGSATLTSALLEHELADEVILAIYPVLVGTGKRFFAEGTPGRTFVLNDSWATPSGIVLNRYTISEPLRTA